jgi:hypothetical protein
VFLFIVGHVFLFLIGHVVSSSEKSFLFLFLLHMDNGLRPSISSSSSSMEEHWNESPEDSAKTLTRRKQQNKERSKALGARRSAGMGIY